MSSRSSTGAAHSPNRTRATQLLIGGLVGWHGGLAVAVLVGIWLGGAVGLFSALIGAALALVYYSIGQGVQVQFADAPPRTLRAASMWSYLVRVGILGLLLYGAIRWPSILASLDTRSLFAGIVLGVFGWLTGLIWRFRTLRVPVFDEPETQDAPSRDDC